MRTVTFSDERVMKALNDDFVCVWRNIRPAERFGDGLYVNLDHARLAKTRGGSGAQNICAHLATAGGDVLHAVQGYAGPDEFLVELGFALELSRADAQRRRDLCYDRLDALEKCRDRNSIVPNLRRFQEEPGLKLDDVFAKKLEVAGVWISREEHDSARRRVP